MKHKTYFGLLGKLLLVGLIVTLVLTGCSPKPEESLKMVIIPGEDAAVELERMKPMTDYVGQQIGMPIEVVVATDYSAAIIALKVGDADIARLGPFSYILAATETKCEPIARAVKKKSGTDSYHSIIITRPDTGIKSLEDVKGRTFAYVDVGSASGYLMPKGLFATHGIDPEEDCERIFFAGSHDAVWLAVKNGTVDAGATNDWRLNAAIEAGQIGADELTIIATSAAIPHSPIVVRGDLDSELITKLQSAWLAIPRELTEEAWGVLRYVKAVDSDYDFLREVAEVLELDLTKME